MILRNTIFITLVAITSFSQLAHGKGSAVIKQSTAEACSPKKVSCTSKGPCIDPSGNNICKCQVKVNSEKCSPKSAKPKQIKNA